MPSSQILFLDAFKSQIPIMDDNGWPHNVFLPWQALYTKFYHLLICRCMVTLAKHAWSQKMKKRINEPSTSFSSYYVFCFFVFFFSFLCSLLSFIDVGQIYEYTDSVFRWIAIYFIYMYRPSSTVVYLVTWCNSHCGCLLSTSNRSCRWIDWSELSRKTERGSVAGT